VIHAYARASLVKQEASTDIQLEMLEKHCNEKGWGKPLAYIDKATTSRIPLHERVSGKQLCDSVKRGDKIVITKMDRAFRSTSECLQMMEHWNRIGVDLHILNFLGGQAVDFSSPLGKMLVTVIVAVAEFERDMIRERTKEAHAYARRNGGGGGIPRHGFKWKQVEINGKKALRQIADTDERKAMREILRLRTEDPPWSWDDIRQHLTYELKLFRTKGFGEHQKQRPWTVSSMMRACKSEVVLQYREALPKRGG
jgi:DNA invertase Pin-like site-specific DNA recombinase